MTLDELRKELAVLADRMDPYDHEPAEQLLLEYINDPEVTELWDRAQDFWWYA